MHQQYNLPTYHSDCTLGFLVLDMARVGAGVQGAHLLDDQLVHMSLLGQLPVVHARYLRPIQFPLGGDGVRCFAFQHQSVALVDAKLRGEATDERSEEYGKRKGLNK